MFNTNIKAEFIVYSDDLNPKLVTDFLGLSPTQSWAKGDDIRGKNNRRKESIWLLSTEYEESLDINNQLSKLLIILNDKKYKLLELVQLYPVNYTMEIVIRVRKGEVPAIYFDSQTISFINEIQAKIDIDLYV